MCKGTRSCMIWKEVKELRITENEYTLSPVAKGPELDWRLSM